MTGKQLSIFEVTIKNALDKKRNYKYASRYEIFYGYPYFGLIHYSTKILTIDLKNRIITDYDVFHSSDNIMVARFLRFVNSNYVNLLKYETEVKKGKIYASFISNGHVVKIQAEDMIEFQKLLEQPENIRMDEVIRLIENLGGAKEEYLWKYYKALKAGKVEGFLDMLQKRIGAIQKSQKTKIRRERLFDFFLKNKFMEEVENAYVLNFHDDSHTFFIIIEKDSGDFFRFTLDDLTVVGRILDKSKAGYEDLKSHLLSEENFLLTYEEIKKMKKFTLFNKFVNEHPNIKHALVGRLV